MAPYLTRRAPLHRPLEGVGGERNSWHGRSRCLPLCPLGGGWWGHRSLCRSGSCGPHHGGPEAVPGSPAEAERQPGAPPPPTPASSTSPRRADTQPTAAPTGVPLVVSSAAGHPRGQPERPPRVRASGRRGASYRSGRPLQRELSGGASDQQEPQTDRERE
jgi:hypothetical protein